MVWSLQSEKGSLGKLMDRVEEQTHVMLDPGEVECNISLSRDYNGLELREEIMQNAFLIFKEALTNIVKHSNADKVEITVHSLDNRLFLAIADNGTSYSPNESNKGGNGLKNMQRRADKMSGRLTISNNEGVRIELLVPKAFAG